MSYNEPRAAVQCRTFSRQAEGVVAGAELSRWRSSWGEAAEAQWVAAGHGKYKESAAQFLVSTWQGDALVVRRAMCSHVV
jgi:hypothetical protein